MLKVPALGLPAGWLGADTPKTRGYRLAVSVTDRMWAMAAHKSSHGKPGRASRGPRKAVMVRVPEAYYATYADEARRRGYTCLGDYANALLAQAHELPVPEFAKPSMSGAHQKGAVQDTLPRAG